MSLNVIIIPTNPDLGGFSCITDREDPSHAWLRAASHIFVMFDFPFPVRMAAVKLLADQFRRYRTNFANTCWR
jgi:hypothetical protein